MGLGPDNADAVAGGKENSSVTAVSPVVNPPAANAADCELANAGIIDLLAVAIEVLVDQEDPLYVSVTFVTVGVDPPKTNASS